MRNSYSGEFKLKAASMVLDVQRYVMRYNTIRPHSYNDYWSPVAMEKLAA